ncbi:MAG: excinuclease ABC subunit UvrB [Bacilli bacterium]
MFKLVSNYKPTGDQPKAINSLSKNLKDGMKYQTLLGATGTGKTFTMANVIANHGKNTLVLAHNKTLAGQLYAEFKSLFPENHVEYFISYYDYYQPEAYVASRDLYIEKDSSINDEIDQMRNSAVSSLLLYDDVIVVSSVSCIYGIGDPADYKENMYVFEKGVLYDRRFILEKLVSMQYARNDYELKRGGFRVKGDIIDIFLNGAVSEAIRLEFFDDELDNIRIIDSLTNRAKTNLKKVVVYPATLFNVNSEKMKDGIERIKRELDERVEYFNKNNKPLEAERIEQRTKYDIEMLQEVGVCSGIENYSRHLGLRDSGSTPYTLMDFFKKDFLLVVDECHVTIPQVRGMYFGNLSRKNNLIDYGFRLPSAADNRPLQYDEFKEKCDQVIYLSATPAEEQKAESGAIVEQIIRPTGLLDPEIEIRETKGQIDDLVKEIYARIKQNERVLIVTITIKMSEDLTKYLSDLDIKSAYLHSEIKSLERMTIINDLRKGTYDVLVGINLLREGLDLPEVGLIAILDADKEGFLRSDTSLIQIIGRAARNSHGKVIMYADKVTGSMERAITETYRRRKIQEQYNTDNNITPTTIKKAIGTDFDKVEVVNTDKYNINLKNIDKMNKYEKEKLLSKLEKQMLSASRRLDFEEAMSLRDIIYEVKANNKKR